MLRTARLSGLPQIVNRTSLPQIVNRTSRMDA
jgi:hypothetical protein